MSTALDHPPAANFGSRVSPSPLLDMRPPSSLFHHHHDPHLLPPIDDPPPSTLHPDVLYVSPASSRLAVIEPKRRGLEVDVFLSFG